MKVRVEAPHNHLNHILKRFDVESISREWAKYLVPDPTKHVELSKYPRLKVIATPSTGTNHIDLAECRKRGIKVLSLLDDRDGLDTIRASSEFAFFMILSGLRLGAFRQWRKYVRDDYIMLGRELYGKFVGIVGFGRIGQNVGKYLSAFDANWVHYDRGLGDDRLRRIFAECDIVLLAPALTEETRGMITAEHLHSMKKRAILVNVARAELIDEAALLDWTAKKGLYVADVLHGETTGQHLNSPLLSRANCIIYPHQAGLTKESNEKAMIIALKLLQKEIENGK